MDQVTAFANSSAGGLLPTVMNFIALIVLSLVFFAFAMKAGRAAFISLVLSLYVGFGLFMIFPFKESLMAGEAMTKAIAALIIFVVLSAPAFLVLRRVNTMGLMRIHPIPLFILSVLSAGAVLAMAYQFLSFAVLLPATPPITSYVLPNQYLFYWLIAPLVAMLVVAR